MGVARKGLTLAATSRSANQTGFLFLTRLVGLVPDLALDSDETGLRIESYLTKMAAEVSFSKALRLVHAGLALSDSVLFIHTHY